jgi:hypothetical protein
VRRHRGGFRAGCAVDPFSEPPHGPDEGTGHRRWDSLQRLQRSVDRRRPLGEVRCPGRPALRLGGVLAVVAGQIQVLDVGKRVPLQDPSLSISAKTLLGGAEMALVVTVGEALTRRQGPKTIKSGPVTARREVHDDAVVLVHPGKLPGNRDPHVPDGPEAAIRHGGRLCPATAGGMELATA